MKQYHVKAKLLAPLMVQRSRQSNAPRGMDYLPGSTLRGALADKYLRSGGAPGDEDFRALFIDNPVYFPNLLPTDPGDGTPSRVLPLTAISCKRKNGFKGEANHGVKDNLAARVLQQALPGVDIDDACPKCRNDMKGHPGFWNGNLDAPRGFRPSMLFTRHTGVDRATGAVAVEKFYITQAMADYYKPAGSEEDYYEQQQLAGAMFVGEDRIEALEPLFNGTIFVGADRTRGMGELELTIHELGEAAPDIDVEEWSNRFKARLKTIAGNNLPVEMETGLYFSIKLESHAILLDRFLRPTSELALDVGDLTNVLTAAEATTIRGWQSSWGLPKPDDLGLAMGSVFLFKYTGDDPVGLKKRLDEIAMGGIGPRREEGYGRASICEPLHNTTEVI